MSLYLVPTTPRQSQKAVITEQETSPVAILLKLKFHMFSFSNIKQNPDTKNIFQYQNNE